MADGDIVRLQRVTELPDVPVVDTVYYVQRDEGDVTEQYVVGHDGVLVPVSLSAANVVAEVVPIASELAADIALGKLPFVLTFPSDFPYAPPGALVTFPEGFPA